MHNLFIKFSSLLLFIVPFIPMLAAGMVLEQQTRIYRPTVFNPANVATANDATLLGSTQRFNIPRSNPLESIWLIVDILTDATGPTPRTGSTGVVGRDNFLNIVKRVTLEGVSDVWGAYKAVDYSGIGLLEYNMHAGLNLDPSTWEFIRLWAAGAALGNSINYRYAIKVPVIDPMIGEPLLTRCLMPIHTWNQDPVLVVDFESGTNLYSAGKIIGLKVGIYVEYREMNDAQTKDVISKGGFIKSDLLESNYSPGLGASGEQRFSINPPGSYTRLLFRQYLGGNAVCTRDVVDEVTTIGTETIWKLETNSNTKRNWLWKMLQIKNGYTETRTALSQTTDVGFSAAIAAASQFQIPASVMIDFMSDAVEQSNELGSVLDCNIPQQSGLKMEVVGNWLAPGSATIPSTIYYGGHRLWGDLSAFKSDRAKLGK